MGRRRRRRWRRRTSGDQMSSSALLLLLLLELLHWIPQLHKKGKHQSPPMSLSTSLPPSPLHTLIHTNARTRTFWWSCRRRDRWNLGCVATCCLVFRSADLKTPVLQEQNWSGVTPVDVAAADNGVHPTTLQSHIIRPIKRDAACEDLIQKIWDQVITLE